MKGLSKLQEEVRKTIRGDPAHDYSHIMRVYGNAKKIARKENVDQRLVLAAVLLHDIVQYPKSDRRSKSSSVQSAKLAERILEKHGFTQKEIDIIVDAIRDHSYSRGKKPKTLVGKILQDADRLDALGAIGIARAFSVGGAEKRLIYNDLDPFCRKRSPDDRSWTVDHFYRKLLKLEAQMHTKSAKREARKRTRLMRKFLDSMKGEIDRKPGIK